MSVTIVVEGEMVAEVVEMGAQVVRVALEEDDGLGVDRGVDDVDLWLARGLPAGKVRLVGKVLAGTRQSLHGIICDACNRSVRVGCRFHNFRG